MEIVFKALAGMALNAHRAELGFETASQVTRPVLTSD